MPWVKHLVTHTEPTPKSPTGSGSQKDPWPLTSTLQLPAPLRPVSKRFDAVLAERRTRRPLSALNLNDTLSIVRTIALPQQLGVGENEGRARKAMISAGALHPIEILIVAGPEVQEPIIYNDSADLFGTVAISEEASFHNEVKKLESFLPDSEGHILLFVGNSAHVEQRYNNFSSLLWRDGGAILQTFAVYACAHDFGFVPLGSTGNELLNCVVAPHQHFVAVGTALIGKPKAP